MKFTAFEIAGLCCAAFSIIIVIVILRQNRRFLMRLTMFAIGLVNIACNFYNVVIGQEPEALCLPSGESDRLDLAISRNLSLIAFGFQVGLYSFILFERYERVFGMLKKAKGYRLLLAAKIILSLLVICHIVFGVLDRVQRYVGTKALTDSGRRCQKDKMQANSEVFLWAPPHLLSTLLMAINVILLEAFINVRLLRTVLNYKETSTSLTSDKTLSRHAPSQSQTGQHSATGEAGTRNFTADVRDKLKRKFYFILTLFTLSDVLIIGFNSLGGVTVLPQDATNLFGACWASLHGIIAFYLLDLFVSTVKDSMGISSRKPSKSKQIKLDIVRPNSSMNTRPYEESRADDLP